MSFSGGGSCNVQRRERYRQRRAAQLVEPGREVLTVLVGLRSAGGVVIPACYLPWPGSAIMMSILAKLRNTVTEVLPSPSCARRRVRQPVRVEALSSRAGCATCRHRLQ